MAQEQKQPRKSSQTESETEEVVESDVERGPIHQVGQRIGQALASGGPDPVKKVPAGTATGPLGRPDD